MTVALGVVALETWSVVSATAHRTSKGEHAAWTAAYRQEQCLYSTIRAVVPEGSTVYVSSGSAEEAQFLTDLAAGWAEPQESRSSAAWIVSVVPGQRCDGLALTVHRA